VKIITQIDEAKSTMFQISESEVKYSFP